MVSSFAVTALFVVTAASGCLAPDDQPPDPVRPAVEEPQAGPPPQVEAERPRPDPVPVVFAGGAPVHHSVWQNGSFAPQETGLGGGFATGAFVRTIDLTTLVPTDVPTRLTVLVTLDGEDLTVVGPTARADAVSNDTVWYEAYRRSPAAGVFEIGGIVKRAEGGTVGIALEAYGPGPQDPPEVRYAVHAVTAAQPAGVPVGVPVALTAAANETLVFQTARENQAELLVYGPDDRLLDRLFLVGALEWTVPMRAAGELVVVPILGAEDLRILQRAEDGTASALRALDIHREAGAAHALEQSVTTTWSFDLERRPLRVGVTVVGPAGEPWACVGSLRVALASPEGPVLGSGADCPSPTNVPFLYEERHTWATHTGDARLTTGTYTVSIDNTLWSAHQAFETVEWYAR